MCKVIFAQFNVCIMYVQIVLTKFLLLKIPSNRNLATYRVEDIQYV